MYPWSGGLACLDAATEGLESTGWLPNQVRMWLASHWSVRHGADWRAGEDVFFRHLLDGSRAANRLGWQWTTGAGGGRPYGFSRWQVTKRAPGLCATCPLERACPIEDWPEPSDGSSIARPRSLKRDPECEDHGGPELRERSGDAEAVWLTAESLGDADPALDAHPGRPAVFVFDAPLLQRLELSAKRLVFLVETLAELATRRPVEIHVGMPAEVLTGRRLAATFTPVPGWRRLAARLDLVDVHPWPWLERPHEGPANSFSAWRRGLRRR